MPDLGQKFHIDECDHQLQMYVFHGHVNECRCERRGCITWESQKALNDLNMFDSEHDPRMLSLVANRTGTETWNWHILAMVACTRWMPKWRIRLYHSNWNALKTPGRWSLLYSMMIHGTAAPNWGPRWLDYAQQNNVRDHEICTKFLPPCMPRTVSRAMTGDT